MKYETRVILAKILSAIEALGDQLDSIIAEQFQAAQQEHGIMANLDQVLADVAAEKDEISSVSTLVAGLRQQVIDALAGGPGGSVSPVMQAKIDAIFAGAEANKQNIAAAIASGGAPLNTSLAASYRTAADFNTAVAAYTGGVEVDLDGKSVKAGTAPALTYFTQADGTVKPTAVSSGGPATLATSFPDAATFNAAVAAYQSGGGTNGVTLDGTVVGNATLNPVVAYFTHSTSTPAGAIDTTGPTN